MMVYRTSGSRSTCYHEDETCNRLKTKIYEKSVMSKGGHKRPRGRYVHVDAARAAGRTPCQICIGGN